MTYQALTARAERMIRMLGSINPDQAKGAFQMWDVLVTELMAFNRAGYEADRARLEALVPGGVPTAA
ncbi:hypothetical protein [Burkholderia ubonensis]|uniref:hypothetical protein n=1 Tax=Burkholderia ubonensis TaxID=101571 RepID=UPI0012F748D8|nr:hypothetical protein [Burkholderia ubonensis]